MMENRAQATVDGPLFDPFAPGFTDDPYPQYARLREEAPVYEHPLGFWLLTRYADVSTLLRSGHSVEDRNAAPGPMRDLARAAYGDRPPRMFGQSMLDKDAPDHTRLRRLVSKAFTPRSIEALRPRIEALVDRMLDDIATAGRVDLIATLAFPLPFAVITEMLGMPEVDSVRLRTLTGAVVRSLEPVVDPAVLAEIVAADDEIVRTMTEVIAWKRANPAEDLLTALIQAEHDGDVLSDSELVAQVALLYIAGHETTVNLIGNGVLALLRRPDALKALREDPALIGNAIEELLRYDSPVQSSRRVMLHPQVVGGVEIPAGAFVIAGLASANRDERFWGEDADKLALDREGARQHVSFGAGPHHCVGAALARLEGQVTLERLIRRCPGLALDGDVRWNGRINLRGLVELPVAV